MPDKPFDQLSKSGKWLRRLREENPECYEERKRRKREQTRERLRQMREEDPQAYAEYLRRQREWKRANPQYLKRRRDRRRKRYQTDPEHREHRLTSKRDWYQKQKEENSERYQNLRQVGNTYNLIFSRALQIHLRLQRGGTCERCGFDDIRALELHHTNEDASERRKEDLRKMRDGEIEYEVLCANCHRIEHYEPPKVLALTPRQAELLLQAQETSS